MVMLKLSIRNLLTRSGSLTTITLGKASGLGCLVGGVDRLSMWEVLTLAAFGEVYWVLMGEVWSLTGETNLWKTQCC